MRRTRSVAAGAVMVLAAGGAAAQVSDGVVRIGVLNDLAAGSAGLGSVAAARMAVEDYGAAKKGLRVEVVSGDHKNSVETGVALARRWYDSEKVDVIVDVPHSGVALAVAQVTRERRRAMIASGAASHDLTGRACNPNVVHWTYDSWMLGAGTAPTIVKTVGDSWFFLTADYAYGLAMERDIEAVVTRAGGKVAGRVRHGLKVEDFAPLMKQAQSSGAKVVDLASAGAVTLDAIRRAAEAGIVKGGQSLAAPLVFLTDVHALGLETAQGLLVSETFYWDRDEASRAFAARFARANKGTHPTSIHAGVYAGVLHYLKAVEGARSDEGTAVVAKMKELPTDDPLFGRGRIRGDGRKIHPAYLFEVKKPADSKRPWDYYRVLATIPADQAFRPEKEGGCPLVK